MKADQSLLEKLGNRIDKNTGKPISEVLKEAGEGVSLRDLGEAPARSVPKAADPAEKPRRKSPVEREFYEQCALFDFLRNNEREHPILKNFTATSNGGKRLKAVAGKMKAAGQKKGLPDILGFVKKRGYTGLCIEMKIYPNDLTVEQAEWFDRLTIQGWLCEKHYRWEEAAKRIFWYLDLPIKIVERGK